MSWRLPREWGLCGLRHASHVGRDWWRTVRRSGRAFLMDRSLGWKPDSRPPVPSAVDMVRDSSQQPSTEELAGFAREEALYSIGDVAALDSFGLSSALAILRYRPIAKQLASIGRRYSMLHPDVITLLYYLSHKSSGDILEIGPYIGGSTIALAKGMRDAARERTFVTVEQGGISEHPTLPSRDIVADLKQNLANNGVADVVQLIVGRALAKKTIDEVTRRLKPESVGLFVMDADGEVELALDFYRDLLMDRCWLVIDDYFTTTAEALDKAARTKAQIDSLGKTGQLEGLAVFGWGTWFGRWCWPPSAA